MSRLLGLFVAVTLSVLSASAAFAQHSAAIGTILQVDGTGTQVTTATAQGFAPAKADMPISKGDTLRVGPSADSRALVILLDGSQFALGPGSEFRAEEYVYDDTARTLGRAFYNVKGGNVAYTAGKMGQQDRSDIRIQTAYGVIQPRDSVLWAGSTADQFHVLVQKGNANFETKRGRIRLTEGQATTVYGANAIPERPATWPQDRIGTAIATTTLSNAASLQQKIDAYVQSDSALLEQHKAENQQTRDDRLQSLQSRPDQKRIDLKNLREGDPAKKEPAGPVVSKTPEPEPAPAEQPTPAAQTEPAPTPAAEAQKAPEEQKAPEPQPAAQEVPADKVEIPAEKLENLPSDPAMKEEALEKLHLEHSKSQADDAL